jgi:hypothetical protein
VSNHENPQIDARIELTLYARPWHLKVNAEVPNLDLALAMLQQALRYFENQQRVGNALQVQAEMRRAVEDERIRAMVSAGKA